MKSYVSAAVIFAVLLVSVPAAPLLSSELKSAQAQELMDREETSESSTQKETDEKDNKKESKNDSEEVFRVLDITTGKVEEISAFDYVVGAVCAEMPATFEPEALKAQAVAAHLSLIHI